jgi:hypothetical protein
MKKGAYFSFVYTLGWGWKHGGMDRLTTGQKHSTELH